MMIEFNKNHRKLTQRERVYRHLNTLMFPQSERSIGEALGMKRSSVRRCITEIRQLGITVETTSTQMGRIASKLYRIDGGHIHQQILDAAKIVGASK